MYKNIHIRKLLPQILSVQEHSVEYPSIERFHLWLYPQIFYFAHYKYKYNYILGLEVEYL